MTREQRIGLLAGWGNFPVVVARALKRQGYTVYCLGIRDHADPALADICDDFRMVGIAKLGAHLRYFRHRQVGLATMAGKIFKARLLFGRWGWVQHLPDWRCCCTFYPHFLTRSRDRTDDTLMTSLIEAYANDGITFAPPTDFAPELLVKYGPLNGRQPSAAQWKDIRFGWCLAKDLGRVDVGQTVVVKGQVAIAVEAVEGTDECSRRAGVLCPHGGFTVVKVAKPQQDMRFDVPTIGLRTLQTLVAAGGRLLAVEAGKTILVDESEVLSYARRHRVIVVAIDAADVTRWQHAA
jgi:DUF1009 family protein